MADEGEGAVAQLGEGLGSIAGADAAGVLGEGAVADAEEPIFDLPVVAGKRQQAGGVHPLGRQAGDGVDDLARAQRPGFT